MQLYPRQWRMKNVYQLHKNQSKRTGRNDESTTIEVIFYVQRWTKWVILEKLQIMVSKLKINLLDNITFTKIVFESKYCNLFLNSASILEEVSLASSVSRMFVEDLSWSVGVDLLGEIASVVRSG